MKRISIIYPEHLGTIAPEIYGHFAEHIGGVIYGGLWVGKDSPIPNINGFRKEIIEKLRKIQAPVLRWPGGCFAEGYNWRDGIGSNRPVRPSWWTIYDGQYETNEFGTHEFLEFCELVGAKPYLAVNVTTITPMEARNWMDYCFSPKGRTTLALEREANGHPNPFDIPYIGVGNENWGEGGNMTPDYYANVYRRFCSAIQNIVDKKAELIIGGANADDYFWTHGVTANLSKSQAHYHGMSFHYYCGQNGQIGGDAINYEVSDWYELIKSALRMEEILCRHAAITEAYGTSENMKLVIDEWGCWHPEGSGPSKGSNLYEQQSTMRDAVITALTLNIFNNHCDKVKMANVAQLCNNLHCLFLAGGENCIVTPTYHVFDMFKEHQGAVGLRTLISDNEKADTAISASASVKDNCIKVTLANLSCESDVELTLDILGLPGEITSIHVTKLSAEDMHAHNTFEAPDTVSPKTYVLPGGTRSLTLPAASVMSLDIYTIPLNS